DYHTYQCKQAKPYKIVIRRLHPTTKTSDIEEELTKLGHEVIRVTNIVIKKKTNGEQSKVALPLFYVDLTTKINNKEVYNLTDMLYCKIKIEPPRIKKDIPQCKRCQGFGHTQNYCQRQAKCVKCGGSHYS
ncbi:Nucleic-acid-binding protein from transposon X-element, partial [Harpegnathos saltator]